MLTAAWWLGDGASAGGAAGAAGGLGGADGVCGAGGVVGGGDAAATPEKGVHFLSILGAKPRPDTRKNRKSFKPSSLYYEPWK